MTIANINYKTHSFTLHTRGESDIYISNWLLKGAIYEPNLTEIWYEHIKEGDLVLDIGANLGWYTKIANLKNAKAIAIEPDPTSFELLTLNCSDKNELHNVCAGNNTNDIMLQVSNNNFGDNRTSDNGDIVCKQNTIDNIVGDRARQIRAIKIDTQGWEPNIISGAINTLKNVSDDCLIIIEYWPYGLTLNNFTSDAYQELFDIFCGRVLHLPKFVDWEESKEDFDAQSDIVIYKQPQS